MISAFYAALCTLCAFIGVIAFIIIFCDATVSAAEREKLCWFTPWLIGLVILAGPAAVFFGMMSSLSWPH